MKNTKLKAEDFSSGRSKEEAIELIKKESNQECFQFQEWWDLFELQSWIRKAEMSELEMWACLSNRFKLVRK